MTSKIEQLIDEIEDYIDHCKFMTLSNTKIIVNKDEIDDLLRNLRMSTPDEIKRYQKMISNRDAILDDAKRKADDKTNPNLWDEQWEIARHYPFVEKDSKKRTCAKALVMTHAYSNAIMDKVEEARERFNNRVTTIINEL